MTAFPTKILLATDRSDDALLAARAAADLSSKTDSELHVVHVWQDEFPRAYAVTMPSVRSCWCEQQADRLLVEQVKHVEGARGKVKEAHLRQGRVAEEIVGLADDLNVGLIVMGSRGLGTVKRLVVGSVSEGVVSLAPCPVLVTRGSWPPSRVIVGDDSSEEARKACELAAGIGRLFGTCVLLVRAFYPTFHLPPPGFLRRARGEENPRARLDELLKTEEAERVLEKQAEELERVLGRRPQTRVAVGDAAAIMLEVAAEES